ncbi:MAG: hypothetical protein KF781_06195 [Chitinophagaceae bacterium]|nr:hypothetical protein [Chitinophagaceae bacterium]MCW5904183.1 hypothetical protein [Chitinophagaceae bacterium]
MVNSLFNWLLIGCVALLHPFYVSKIELNHNVQDKSVEISIRVFTDDMELTLENYGNTSIDIMHPKNPALVDSLLKKYIQEKLKISIDNHYKQLDYVGFEINKESVWVYMEIPNIATLQKVTIFCNFLYDYKQEQINIFQVKANGKDKSYKLENPKASVVFEM